MKLLQLIAVMMVCFAMQGCVKFADTDQWVFAEGLWLILLLPIVGGGLLIWTAYRASKSGTTQQTLTGGTQPVAGKIPIYKLWKFRLGVILLIAALIFFIYQNTQR